MDKKKWVHRLSNINREAKRGDCAECGIGSRLYFRKNDGCFLCWNSYTKLKYARHKVWYEKNRRQALDRHKNSTYRGHKGPVCEACGFVPKHVCQLDVDHIDGYHNNDVPENLQTLCANCHRLKSLLERPRRPKDQKTIPIPVSLGELKNFC